MVQLLSVPLPNEPGALAHAMLSLAGAGVQVRALDTDSLGEVAVARFVVDDLAHARSVLRAAGHPTQVLDAIRVTLAGGAHEMGEVCRRLGAAGVNIRQSFTAPDKNGAVLFLVVDRPELARVALAAREVPAPA